MGALAAPSTSLADLAAKFRPEVALVLGSGLNHLAEHVRPAASFRFAEIPGLADPTVESHRGILTFGTWGETRLLVFEGRLHFYEGHSWNKVESPVRIAAELGVRTIFLTNAAGGIRDDLQPGSLIAIRDHIEWNRPQCWRSENCATPYSPQLIERLQAAGRACGVHVSDGVYAAVTGPNYETPAEIRALRAWGADAVGMSTTREALAAANCGLQCVALSCITNRAAGLGAGPINHEEVMTTAGEQAEKVGKLLETFMQLIRP
jgi:purine-nucleoside phosphorylase